jgi:hypothetical protein
MIFKEFYIFFSAKIMIIIPSTKFESNLENSLFY